MSLIRNKDINKGKKTLIGKNHEKREEAISKRKKRQSRIKRKHSHNEKEGIG